MSSFVMIVAPPSRSNNASMRGIGKGSGSVKLFNLRKSTHRRPVPSGLGTTKIGAAQGLLVSSIIPCSNNEAISVLTARCFSGCSQEDGGELPIPTFLSSYSCNCNGSRSISYSRNVLFKKVDMKNSPRPTSVGGSYHIIYLTNTLFNHIWSKELGLERFTD